MQAPPALSASTGRTAVPKPLYHAHRSPNASSSALHAVHGKATTSSSSIDVTPRSNSRSSKRQVSTKAVGIASATRNAKPTKVDNVFDVVVVGGGISGLTTAQALKVKHGMSNFLMTEARERVGGNITSLQKDGFIWEEGPNSFQPSDSVLQIAVDNGVEKDLVFGDPTAPRFVYWDKKLRATPSGLDAVTFDLLTIVGKIRAGLGAIGLFKAPPPGYEESVEQFIRRNLGDEVFERLIEPFCSGVYAGDPSKLGMKAAFNRIWSLEAEGGSLVGGAIKFFNEKKKNPGPPRDPSLPPKPKGQTVGSFRNGLQTLPEAVARNIKDQVRVNWKLLELFKSPSGLYSLLYETPEGLLEVSARCVALTVPAYVAAEIVRRECPDAADALKSFDYPPVGAVTVSYPNSAIRDDRKNLATGEVPGFGQLHPRSQGITTLGTIYSSSLFPGRAPNGDMLILNYIGGCKNRNVLNQTKEQLVEQVDKDLRIMLIKPDAPPPTVVGVRVWPKAIPQFNVGHLDTVAAAKAGLADQGWDGVLLGGNYVAGVALGKCVEYGYDFAKEINSYIAAQPALQKREAGVRV